MSRSDLWPLETLVVSNGSYRLMTPCNAALLELGPDLDGSQDPIDAARALYRQVLRNRSAVVPTSWTLDLTVSHEESTIGFCSLTAKHFAVIGSVETSSWLRPSSRGRGHGRELRLLMLSLAFDFLGAGQVTSTAFDDNRPSRQISLRLGYSPNGRTTVWDGQNVRSEEHWVLPHESWSGGRATVTCDVRALPMLGASPVGLRSSTPPG